MTTDHQAQVDAAREECERLLNQAKAGFCPSYYEKQEQAIDRLAALVSASPAPAASELVAGYMPTYGQIPWQALIDAVSEAQIGKPGLWKPDEGCFVGHAPVTMNMNSLNRIVSKFAAPQPPAASSDALDAARLDAFTNHPGWELSMTNDPEEDESRLWQVNCCSGGRNDREWDLIGVGPTPRAAIDAALKGEHP